MAEYAIFLTAKIKPGARDEVLSLISENARGARNDEPGCRTFDVLVSPDDPDTIHAYEVYDDADAFEAHHQAPHFKKFIDAIAGKIESRTVVQCERVDISK